MFVAGGDGIGKVSTVSDRLAEQAARKKCSLHQHCFTTLGLDFAESWQCLSQMFAAYRRREGGRRADEANASPAKTRGGMMLSRVLCIATQEAAAPIMLITTPA